MRENDTGERWLSAMREALTETHKKELEEMKKLLAEQKRETESKMAELKKEMKVPGTTITFKCLLPPLLCRMNILVR